jgi:hypothetical protein
MNIKELEQKVNELMNQIASMNNPSDEYKANLEQALAGVGEKITSINDIVDGVKKHAIEQGNVILERLKGLHSEIKNVVSGENFNPPSIIKITPRPTMLDIKWEKVDGADKYSVYYRLNEGGEFKRYGTTSNFAKINGLAQDTVYEVYIVSETFLGGESVPSKLFIESTTKLN